MNQTLPHLGDAAEIQAELQAAIGILRRIAHDEPSSIAAMLLDVLESTPPDKVLAEFRLRCLKNGTQVDRALARWPRGFRDNGQGPQAARQTPTRPHRHPSSPNAQSRVSSPGAHGVTVSYPTLHRVQSAD